MEDSFRVRADKVFGSLGSLGSESSASSPGVSSSLWCLGDEEIERREWKRSNDYAGEDGDGGTECSPPVFQNPLDSDLQELRDYEEEEEEREDDEEIDGGKKKRTRRNYSGVEASSHEYLDVQLNIGRDCTLDYEEEEDQYDKVAVGVEQSSDRLYMRDVKFSDYGTHELSDCSEFPGFVKDPRANHVAAGIRLKEDDEAAAGIFNTSQQSNDFAPTSTHSQHSESSSRNNNNPKSILKNRANLEVSRSDKHVRFAFDSTSPIQSVSSEHFSMSVPGYLRNPSKYTHYTFDSSNDMDNQSNREAYLDLFNIQRRTNVEPSIGIENPKTVMFVPRTKGSIERKNSTGDDNGRRKGRSVGVTKEDDQESEGCVMEEDDTPLAADKVGRQGRQYRARASVGGDDDLN